jgi:hypothetical protein
VRARKRPLHSLAILGGDLLVPDLVRQLVDRAGEPERQFVAVVHGRAGIEADVETSGLEPVPQRASLRGITDELEVYEIP